MHEQNLQVYKAKLFLSDKIILKDLPNVLDFFLNQLHNLKFFL